ncbi:MAG TPA: MBL fold metallo-hydrolase [Rectinemataceae bacterium]|nr:MBL fold metallo-hydrolase [Rectinemataceae bacterium]
MTLKDIETQESRELFLASLPDYLFSTIGGNTACIEVQTGENARFIFDAGTGIRDLGVEIAALHQPVACHVFFSHFHWDHIQGLPFFTPAFEAGNILNFYSPVPDFRVILENQMRQPYFPVTMDLMASAKRFTVLDGNPVRVGAVEVRYREMHHPGGCYSYQIREGGLKIIYSTDTELREDDFQRTPENIEYFQDTDLLVIDAQYTLGESLEKYNWGHSSFSLAADFAASWGIKKLVLFHHEPSYSDRKIESLFKNAQWYVEHLETRGVQVLLAHEGLEIEVQ